MENHRISDEEAETIFSFICAHEHAIRAEASRMQSRIEYTKHLIRFYELRKSKLDEKYEEAGIVTGKVQHALRASGQLDTILHNLRKKSEHRQDGG